MATNYTSGSDEFYKVSFVTTHSNRMPTLLRQTGSLIIMDNVDEDRRSLWFRGQLVASGYGFQSPDEIALQEFFTNNMNNIFGKPNGVYNFIPGYTKGNSYIYEDPVHPGTYSYAFSILDRLNVITKYLNDAYTASYKGNSYNTQYTYNLQDWSTKAYAYTNTRINYTYDTLFSYINLSYNRGYETDKAIKNYAYESYMNSLAYTRLCYQKSYDYTYMCYTVGYETDKKIFSYCNDFTVSTYQMMHNYVDAIIERLVGGAPETVNTLKEISYWLGHNHDHGLDNAYWINSIRNNYVTHKSDVVGGYVYLDKMATYTYPTWSVVGYSYETGKWTVADPNSYNDIDQQWKTSSYVSYTYQVGTLGHLALEAEQVRCGYVLKGIQLDDALLRLMPPYPYQIPTLKLDPSWLSELNNSEHEVYEKYTVIPTFQFNIKDAAGCKLKFGTVSTSIQNTGDNIMDTTSPIVIYKDDKRWATSAATLQLSSLPYNGLPLIELEYEASLAKVYPDLRGLNDEYKDELHRLPAGSFTLNTLVDVKIPTYWKLFFGYHPEANPWNGAKHNLNSTSATIHSKLLKNMVTKSNVIADKRIDCVWVAIPKPMQSKILSVKVEDFNTGISQELYHTACSKNDLYDITRKDSEYTIDGTTIQYLEFIYKAKRFVTDTSIRIIVEFTDTY